jgi:membrane-associated phospholipid phosphatase
LKPEYRVATGHGTLYWDTGWNQIQVNLSAGRYLAGDMGATIEVFREFDNGVRAGAWATKTNVSSTQFGEGSFDKGFYLSVPFDAILTRSSGTLGHFVWRPLTRDGGAKLDRQIALYDLTRQRDDRALRYKTAPQPNDNVISADRRESWTPAPAVPAPAYRILSRVDADKWRADPRFEERLVDDLYRQGFRNIRVEFDGAFRLTVTLAGDTLRPVSRAVGRAARTALRFAPLDAREIRIVYAETVNPVVRYDFMDLARLARFFDGAIGEAEIADVVGVETIDPSVREANPLARLADLDSTLEPRRFADMVLPDPRNVQRVATDVAGAVDAAGRTDWTRFALWGAGITLGSSLLDRRLDNFARDHAGSRWVKGVTKVGDALPWAALGGAAALALDTSDPARSKTSFAAVEAGGVAILAATGLKYLVGRQRPGDGASNREFQFLTGAASYDSFPSRHAITSWAVVTPFAEQYRAPWLYGVAAITNAARVGSRQHWFSDTVASSFLGYGIGKMFHDASREPAKGVPKVSFGGRNLNLAWEFN